MNNFSNYFKKIDVCEDFKEAKLKAKYEDEPYKSPCDSGEKGVLAFIKRIPCKIREFGCFLSHSFSKSWKLRFITIFIILLFCLNAYLISKKHYNVKDTGESVAMDSIYLTTTQVTTIGYGDIIPQTYTAKMVSSIVHIVVMFLAYSLAEEFGYVTVARSKQTEEIKENVKKDLAPIKVELTPEIKEKIRNNIVQRMSAPENKMSFDQTAKANQTIHNAQEHVSHFAENMLALRKNAKPSNNYSEKRIYPDRDAISE